MTSAAKSFRTPRIASTNAKEQPQIAKSKTKDYGERLIDWAEGDLGQKMTRANNFLIWAVLICIVMLIGGLLSQQIAINLLSTKNAVAEIQSAQEKLTSLQMLVDTIPGGVCVVDDQGIIRYANEGLEQLSIYNRRGLIGRSFLVLMPEEYREDHRARFEDPSFSASEQAAYQCFPKGKLLRSDGKILTVETTIRRSRQSGRYEWLIFFDHTEVTIDG